MKIKHIAAGLALLAMPFTAQAEVREAGLVDGFGMSLIYPAVHTKISRPKMRSIRILQGMFAV